MSTFWLGVDPGVSGGCVLVSPAGRTEYNCRFRMPMIAVDGGKDEHSAPAIISLVRAIRGSIDDDICDIRIAIEEVHGGPLMAGHAGFRFGMGFGIWLATAAALEIPIVRLRPQEWQRVVFRGRSRKDPKATAMLVAGELFPELQLRSKSADSGIADAALIAEAARRLVNARDERKSPL